MTQSIAVHYVHRHLSISDFDAFPAVNVSPKCQMFRASVRVIHRFKFTPRVLQSTRYTANLSRHPPIPQTGGLLTQQSLRQRQERLHVPLNVAWFHSTQSRQGLPVLLGALKASTMLEVARTVVRVALTFIPFMMFKNRSVKKLIIHHDRLNPDRPITEERKAAILKCQRTRTMLTHILLFVPAALFWLAILASAEQTPLTGRWRLIVLSPEEEDEIAAQLAGPKWFQAVSDILSHDGPMKLIPAHDWRYQWVQDTLNRLENVIPILQREHELNTRWLDVGPDEPPLPPPAEYPLRPRPRATDRMRTLSEALYGRKLIPSAHVIAGPPYSLLVADRPDAANAFSYGFGPDGACGIVIYSGFLDDILSKAPVHSSHRTSVAPHSSESSWRSYLFGSLLGIPPTSSTTPSHPIPTEEQTTELAILLAHEVAHLVLSHHIETVSSGTIIIPTMMSLFADVARTLVFPVTMFFGPFFNDGIAQMGKIGSGRLTELGESCTSMKQEIEADIVSARLLAYAGFDAREAVAFWESRGGASKCSSTKCDSAPSPSPTWHMMGASHPVREVRIEKLKNELVRWELEKRVATRQRAEGMPSKRIPNRVWALL